MIKPCLECGVLSTSSRCPAHRAAHRARQRGSARARGYDTAWDRLSKRARSMQPWCSDCGTAADLTVDHLPSAWERKAAGKQIRLQDVDVVCGPCNSRRGSSRPGERRTDPAGRGSGAPSGPGGKPQRQMKLSMSTISEAP